MTAQQSTISRDEWADDLKQRLIAWFDRPDVGGLPMQQRLHITDTAFEFSLWLDKAQA